MGRLETYSKVALRIAKQAGMLYSWMHDLAARMPELSVRGIVEEVVAHSGFEPYLDTLDDASMRKQNLAEMLTAASAFDAEKSGGGLPEFLERVALVSDSEQIDSSGGRAALMTLHTSKGLEYPIVFIAGMEEGLFPHSRSADIDEEVEEERRLCYVGMTRARQLLYLTNTLSREIYGVRQESRQSRFMREIDPALIRRIAPERHTAPVRPLSPREAYVDYGDSQLPDDEPGPGGDGLSIGAKVVHPTFGRGIVRRREGRGDSAKAWVNFDRGGIKLLVLKFANSEVDCRLIAPVSFHLNATTPAVPFTRILPPTLEFMKRFINIAIRFFPALLLIALVAIPAAHGAWTEDEFEKRPLYAYPLPRGKDDIIGNLITYQIQKGDTLLDVGRWFGVTAKEISNANTGIDWWAPPAGRSDHSARRAHPAEYAARRDRDEHPRDADLLLFSVADRADSPESQRQSDARQVRDRQKAFRRSHAVGGVLVPGRPRAFRLENPGGSFHGPRQDPQSDLGGAG